MLQTETRRGAAEGRECGCPPWAVRCAHVDGQILLLDNSDCPLHGPIDPAYRKGDNEWAVSLWDEMRQSGRYCCKVAFFNSSSLGNLSWYPDLPAAEAEFRAREMAMLGRAE